MNYGFAVMSYVKKSVKIYQRSKSRMTDNTMAEKTGQIDKKMVHITLSSKLKIEQHEPL